MVLLLRIDSPQRALPRRHRGAAREGVLRRALDGGRDLSLDRLEAGRRHAVRLEVLLVQPDRVALPPLLKQLGGKRLTRLALVVRRVPAHAEGLGDEQRGALAAAAAVGGELRGRVGVEHVVAVELRAPGAVARRPIPEMAGKVRSEEHTSELRSHSDLVCRLLLEKKKKTKTRSDKK